MKLIGIPKELLANTDIPELRSAMHSLMVSHRGNDSKFKKKADINKVAITTWSGCEHGDGGCKDEDMVKSCSLWHLFYEHSLLATFLIAQDSVTGLK